MRRERMIAATTGIDAHGERITHDALAAMAEAIGQEYIPLWIDHDLRYPTVGRVVDARLVELADGETALEQVVEFWEPGDTPETTRGDGRRIPLDIPDRARFGITIDRSFLTHEGRAFTKELSQLAGNVRPKLRVKKALEPVAWLVIELGKFALGGIALGILGKIGADSYDAVRAALARRQDEFPEEVLDFNLGVTGLEGDYEAHVLVTGPGDNVRSVFDMEFAGVDEAIGRVVEEEADVARIVILWKDGHMTVAHAARSDGYPVAVNPDSIPNLPALPSGTNSNDS